MKRIIYSVIFSTFYFFSATAQNTVDEVLKIIETNNTTLKAYWEKSKAEKIGNKTGLTPSNPEFEFGYLWGSPSTVGNETDINVKQSFDFPTAYQYKSQLATERNRQVDFVYDQQAKDILQQARILCVELIYQTKLNRQLKDRLEQAKTLSDDYQRRFDQGDIDILELNKTKLNLLNAEKALQINAVELNTISAELQRLNGSDLVIFKIALQNHCCPIKN